MQKACNQNAITLLNSNVEMRGKGFKILKENSRSEILCLINPSIVYEGNRKCTSGNYWKIPLTEMRVNKERNKRCLIQEVVGKVLDVKKNVQYSQLSSEHHIRSNHNKNTA